MHVDNGLRIRSRRCRDRARAGEYQKSSNDVPHEAPPPIATRLWRVGIDTSHVNDGQAGAHSGRGGAARRSYSGRVSPEPPNSFGKSRSFGSPSLTLRTASW